MVENVENWSEIVKNGHNWLKINDQNFSKIGYKMGYWSRYD
jgi:hypothetical protein